MLTVVLLNCHIRDNSDFALLEVLLSSSCSTTEHISAIFNQIKALGCPLFDREREKKHLASISLLFASFFGDSALCSPLIYVLS